MNKRYFVFEVDVDRAEEAADAHKWQARVQFQANSAETLYHPVVDFSHSFTSDSEFEAWILKKKALLSLSGYRTSSS